ncbi:MAG: amino acid adenylation domain-containing protein [Fusobacteria bacterium]|nr:amino acid adenylation domain-containing protein [Fusobacteriota bacterium]
MERFKEHYIKVLENILEFENQTISEVEMITEEEREYILSHFSRGGEEYKERSIIKQFEDSVKKEPEAVAVVCGERRVSYSELNGMANSLAKELRSRGVGKNRFVGVLLGRDIEIIVAMLAIQKAGGAYCPIDSKYPLDRIEYMLKDSESLCLISEKSLIKTVSYSGEYIDAKEFEYELTAKDIEREEDLEEYFCLIYTSGTTGQPKGAILTHRNIACFVDEIRGDRGIKYGESVAVHASFSFDAHIIGVFPTLTVGAAIHIIRDEIRLSLHEIHNYIEKNKVVSIFFTTQLAEQYMEEYDSDCLRCLDTGGEKLRKFIPRNYRFINGYGPTECTLYATCYDVKHYEDNIPIGMPKTNTGIYIVDSSMNLLPFGISGELCISGLGVGAGYYKKPELTEKVFVKNPFNSERGYERLYKTGDLAQYCFDGTIRIIGRIDHQVKIRGFRIEIGEIESRMLEIGSIEDVAILAIDDEIRGKYLVGYYVSREAESIEELKEKLEKNLPEYMVPTLFVHMENFPLTPNGKVDRKALPIPKIEMTIKTEYVAPRNETEATVAKIYAQVLGMKKVGIDDNFNDLGVNSLKAVGLTVKLQSNGFNIAVTDNFKFKTIRELLDNTETQKYDLMDKFTSIKNRIQKSIELSNSDEFKEYLVLANKKYQKSVENSRGINYTSSNVNTILLTGATGFLGSHVLNRLLEESDKKVYCIVRGKSDVDAFERTEITYQQYFGESLKKYKTRVVVFSGNLSDEKLGVVPHNYSILAESVESIIHCAANVGHYGEYDKFYHDNVIPVKRLIELALEGIKKDFHYVSTSSVINALNIEGTKYSAFSEDDDIYSLPESDNVYIQTKLEGERETVRARELGINTSIYRIGNLVFNSQTKKHQKNLEDNAFFHTIKSALNLGCLCETFSSAEMSCVDYTAKGITLLFDKRELQNQCFHLYSPDMTSIIECLSNTTEKIHFNKLGIDEFLKILHTNFSAKAFEDYINKFMLHFGWLDEDSEKTLIVCQGEKTNMILSNLGFTWYKIQGNDLLGMVDDAFQKRYQLVSKVPIFYTLDETLIRSIGKKMALKNYNINMEIFKEGNRDNKLYVVIEGAVEILQSISGGWIRSVGLYGDSSILGAFNLFEQKKASYTAEALYETVILEVSAQEIKEYAFSNPELLFNILKDEMTKKEQYMKIMALLG